MTTDVTVNLAGWVSTVNCSKTSVQTTSVEMEEFAQAPMMDSNAPVCLATVESAVNLKVTAVTQTLA
jgi:hypothetical protein